MAPCNKNGEIFEHFYSANYTTVQKFPFPVYQQGFFLQKDKPQENCQISRIIKTMEDLWSYFVKFANSIQLTSGVYIFSEEQEWGKEGKGKKKEGQQKKKNVHTQNKSSIWIK